MCFDFGGEKHDGAGNVLNMICHGRVEEVEAAEELYACCLREKSVDLSVAFICSLYTYGDLERKPAMCSQFTQLLTKVIHDLPLLIHGQTIHLYLGSYDIWSCSAAGIVDT